MATLLALGLGAAELEWSGGELALDEACRLLVQAGYPTTIGPDLDPRHTAEVPMFAGGYWTALLAIGRAFDCVPAPPGASHRYRQSHQADTGLVVDLEGGPVELVPREGPWTLVSAHGALLVELVDAGVAERRQGHQRQRSAGILLHLRLSPDVPRESIGPGLLVIESIRGADGSAPRWIGEADAAGTGRRLAVREELPRRGEPVAILLPELDRRPSALRIVGHVDLALLRHERIELEMRPGERQAVRLRGGVLPLDVFLHDTQSATGTPWQRPGLGIGFPTGIEPGAEPVISVSDPAGAPLRDFGLRTVGGRQLVCYTYLHRVQEGPYRVTAELSLRAEHRILPFALDVPLP